MENLDRVKTLLEKVREIRERENMLSILRGENFNIFRILGIENEEARMHTKFLFELINPDGAHEKGKVFLDAFLKVLTENLKGKIEIPSYKLVQEKSKEKHIGKVDFEAEDGGGIDIYVETDTFCLAVENKIFAKLGHKQLERYYSFISSKRPKIPILLLLTPSGYIGYDGKLSEGVQFYQITYREEILKWLELCHQNASDSPILRETIKQYIVTIKGLLGMLTNQETNKELQALINLYIDEAKLIHGNFGIVHANLKEQLFLKTIELVNVFLSKKGDYEKLILVENGINIQNGGFSIRNAKWTLGLSLYFEGASNLASGIVVQVFLDRRRWTNSYFKEKYKNTIRSLATDFKGARPADEIDRWTYERMNLNRFFGPLKIENIDFIAQGFSEEIIRYFNKYEEKIDRLDLLLKSNDIA